MNWRWSGLARERPDATALLPEAVSKLGGPNLGPYVGVMETRVDQVLAQWIAALREQAGLTAESWGADHDAAQRRRGKGKGSRRRR